MSASGVLDTATSQSVLCAHCHQSHVRYHHGKPCRYCSRRCGQDAARLRNVGAPDRRRFPVAPLLEAVVRRYGTLQDSGWRTSLQRLERQGDMSAKQADSWAVRLGKHPYEIWDDWYSVPQTQEVA
jgi:hypothetical protein